MSPGAPTVAALRAAFAAAAWLAATLPLAAQTTAPEPRLTPPVKPGTFVVGSLSVAVRTASDTVRMVPFRYQVDTEYGVRHVCGLRIEREGDAFLLPVVGLGQTETVSCDAVTDVAAVLRGGRVAHVVMTSVMASPNGAGEGMQIVSLPRSGHAFVDDDLALRLMPTGTPNERKGVLDRLQRLPDDVR